MSKDGVYYVAKVMKIDKKRDKLRIHFHGWNSRYDEWVITDHVHEYNDENELEYITEPNKIKEEAEAESRATEEARLQEAKEAAAKEAAEKNAVEVVVKDEVKEEPKTEKVKEEAEHTDTEVTPPARVEAIEKPPPPAPETPATPTPTPHPFTLPTVTKPTKRGRKGKRKKGKQATPSTIITTRLTELCGSARTHLTWPETLKAAFIDIDRTLATEGTLALPKPAGETVDAIITAYLESGVPDEARLFARGIPGVFDKFLHPLLLHPGEAAIDGPPSEVYGIEHLLRLVVRMPAIWESTAEPVTLGLLVQQGNELLKWMDSAELTFGPCS